MNEHSLAVGMAAVPGNEMPYLPDASSIDSLMIIREVLDHAQDVDKATQIFQCHNINLGNDPL